MDNFHIGIIEALGAEYRADALAHVERARLARRVAAPGSSPARLSPLPLARLAQLIAHASARLAPSRLGR